MADIILNEMEYAQEKILNNDMGKNPLETFAHLARYYRYVGYDDSDIKSMLEQFILRCEPNANISYWEDSIDYRIRSTAKQRLIIIDHIPITEEEIERCKSTGSARRGRLLFTLICYAKYANIVRGKDSCWINSDDKDIFCDANVRVTIRQQSLMLNDLKEMGYISFNNIVDSTSIRVDCLDSGRPAIKVTDFRNLGYQFSKFVDDGTGEYIQCKECGIITPRKGRRNIYCKECATEVNRRKTADRMASL